MMRALSVRLFWEFFKTGLFAVGGGLATLPFLQDMADRTGWFTHAQLADMLAVSESTPGPIGVNMATYVGFTTGGVGGALVATLGLVAPSVIVILIVGGSAVIRPLSLNGINLLDFAALGALALMLTAAAYLSREKLGRTAGAILLAIGVAYNAFLIATI